VDKILGQAGDDKIVYDATDSVINGGSGRDTLILKVGATIDLSTFTTNQVTSGSAYVSGFENLDASGASAGSWQPVRSSPTPWSGAPSPTSWPAEPPPTS
jgi:serralysin